MSEANDFDNARVVESCVWQMKLADYPRDLNRARIDRLYNGEPPYSEEEERDNQIEVNVNPLGGTKLAHDARSQLANGLMKPGKFANATTDYGPVHKRQEYSAIVSNEWNRPMKRSPFYWETLRGKIAQNILHGIAPAAWDDRDCWCPDDLGVEDVMIPSGTTVKMKNLPFFAIWRSWTGAQLKRFISGPKVDKAWNIPLVKKLIQWVDAEAVKTMGTTWAEVWSPTKQQEREKGDGALYAADQVATIDAWDFYFYDHSKRGSGWNRRVVLDAYGQPGVSPAGAPILNMGSHRYGDTGKGEFLYNPEKRVYGMKRSEIISFQFADLSAVAPFRYHSVRSLGYLIWAICHLQNRLFCRIQEATFEGLLQYFRVKSMEDAERAIKLELINRGFIDETINPIQASERWQPNIALAQFAYETNDHIIDGNSSSFVQKQEYSQGSERKTKFQVGAELQAATQLVSAALYQVYKYQTFEYQEIFRRFMRRNSRDADVRTFRANCLRQGVPEKLLVAEAWDISAEQVLGSGNKTLEMAIAQQLLEMRNLYDPEPQRKILRDVTLAVTDNAARTEELVPEQPVKVTDSVHDAQLAAGALMMGLPVALKLGINHIEVTETLLGVMQTVIQKIEKRGAMATEEEIVGLTNVANHIEQHIQIIGQDEEEKERVKKYGDVLGGFLNQIKGYAQRLGEQRRKQQQQNGDIDAETKTKLQAQLILAQAKASNAKESHAQKTAQRQVSFDLKQQQDAQSHSLEQQKKLAELKTNIQAEDLKTSAEIRRNRLKSLSE